MPKPNTTMTKEETKYLELHRRLTNRIEGIVGVYDANWFDWNVKQLSKMLVSLSERVEDIQLIEDVQTRYEKEPGRLFRTPREIIYGEA